MEEEDGVPGEELPTEDQMDLDQSLDIQDGLSDPEISLLASSPASLLLATEPVTDKSNDEVVLPTSEYTKCRCLLR